MYKPNENPDDGLLDRAIAALRDAGTSPGPTLDLRQRTLAEMERADRAIRRRNLWVTAAAAVFVVGCCVPLIRWAYHQASETPREVQQLQTRINTPAPISPVAPEPPVRQPVVPAPTPPIVVASDLSISGHVYYRGPRTAPAAIDLRSCPQCAQAAQRTLYDDSLVVNDNNTLQNVVVSISAGLPPGEHFAVTQAPVMLDQKGCMFHPHVIAAMVGQPIVVRNSDPFLHSVHSMDAELSPAFDFAQPTAGERHVEPLRVVETFQVKCDLHPWMNAWVRVFDHPYFAVTSADGSFAIRRLPPGKYRLKAWHERLGVREKTIEVHQGAPTTIDFTFDE